MVLTRKSLRENVLNNICSELDRLSKTTNNGRVPYGAVSRILEENIVDNPWINRDKINLRLGNIKMVLPKLQKHLKRLQYQSMIL